MKIPHTLGQTEMYFESDELSNWLGSIIQNPNSYPILTDEDIQNMSCDDISCVELTKLFKSTLQNKKNKK